MCSLPTTTFLGPFFSWCAALALMGCPPTRANEIERLVAASKAGYALYGSSPRCMVELADEDVERAVSYINAHPDYTSYHLLFVLCEYHREEYARIPPETRAAIMASSLLNMPMNDWGLLAPEDDEFTDGRVAKEFLKLGAHALGHLAPILNDKRPAPCFSEGYGTEMSTISSVHQYRRCDYAYRYAMLLLGERPVFHLDVDARDRDIESLKRRLAVMAYMKAEDPPVHCSLLGSPPRRRPFPARRCGRRISRGWAR